MISLVRRKSCLFPFPASARPVLGNKAVLRSVLPPKGDTCPPPSAGDGREAATAWGGGWWCHFLFVLGHAQLFPKDSGFKFRLYPESWHSGDTGIANIKYTDLRIHGCEGVFFGRKFWERQQQTPCLGTLALDGSS